MKSKILLVVFALACAWILLSYMRGGSDDVELSKEAYCAELAREGDVEAVSKIIKNDIKSPRILKRVNASLCVAQEISAAKNRGGAIDTAKPALENVDLNLFNVEMLRYAVTSGKSSPALEEKLLSGINQTRTRAVAYALIALRCKGDGDLFGAEINSDRALGLLKKLSAVSSQTEMLLCGDIFIKLGDSRRFIELLKISHLSSDLILQVFDGMECENIFAEYKNLINSEAFSKAYQHLWNAMSPCVWVKERFDGRDYAALERSLPYVGLQFNTSWSIKKWENYRYPALAYLTARAGFKSASSHYADLSVSPTQLYDMRAGYLRYAEYAGKIFLRLGDKEKFDIVLDAVRTSDIRQTIERKTLGATLR